MNHDSDLCNPGEIVALVQAGDMAALDRIMRCYGDYLLAVGSRACGDREVARDAVADALLAAGQNMDQYRGDGSVQGWLSRMVANACHRRRRGRKNDPAWNQELDPEVTGSGGDAGPAGSGGAAPDQCTACIQLSEHLRGALLALPALDRAVLLLTQLEGWTAAEAGEALGLSSEAVRARLTRVRRRLRDELAPVWDEWAS